MCHPVWCYRPATHSYPQFPLRNHFFLRIETIKKLERVARVDDLGRKVGRGIQSFRYIARRGLCGYPEIDYLPVIVGAEDKVGGLDIEVNLSARFLHVPYGVSHALHHRQSKGLRLSIRDRPVLLGSR